MKPFSWNLENEDIEQERRKARELRASQWWKRQCTKGVCGYCEKPTPVGELTMDHIVPLSRGGRTTKGNVIPVCKDCNTAKRQKLLMEWNEGQLVL